MNAYQFAYEGQLFVNPLGGLVKYEQGEFIALIAPSHYASPSQGASPFTEKYCLDKPYQGRLDRLMPTT